jgi:hypothetical protein
LIAPAAGYRALMSTQHPDQWSEPVSEDDAEQQDDSPIDDDGRAAIADSTSPSSGLADPGPDLPGSDVRPTSSVRGEPPTDDEREHPADFARDGYDDRQEDARPDAPRETPDEYVDRRRS